MMQAIINVIGDLPEEYYVIAWSISAAFLYTFVLQFLDFIKSVINK